MTEEIVIEDFRGDAAALEKMACHAWRDEYGIDSYPNLYKPEYLDYLMRGMDDPRLAIAAYQGDEIVGFLLSIPRIMTLDGVEYRVALTCLLVVRREQMRRGLAQAMIEEGLKRNEALQFDFTLFYLETGHRSSWMFKKLARAGFPIERVKRMRITARVLNMRPIRESENIKWYEGLAMRILGADHPPAGDMDPRTRIAGPEDAPAIAELLNRHKDKVRLARVFSEEEVERELLAGPIARTVVWDDGGIKGVIASVTVDHVGRKTVPWSWVNHVWWDELSLSERFSFTRSYLLDATARGHAGVVEWTKNTYPTAALYLSRFVPYPRSVDMMSWRFRNDITLSDIPDVYEVQI